MKLSLIIYYHGHQLYQSIVECLTYYLNNILFPIFGVGGDYLTLTRKWSNILCERNHRYMQKVTDGKVNFVNAKLRTGDQARFMLL
jgi:hypothetical protein